MIVARTNESLHYISVHLNLPKFSSIQFSLCDVNAAYGGAQEVFISCVSNMVSVESNGGLGTEPLVRG